VIVLGERRSTMPDLWRAARVVRGLARRDEVTLALADVEAVHQGVLDRIDETRWADLPPLLDWPDSPFWPYRPLLAAGKNSGALLAVGQAPAARPADARGPIPPGYAHALAASLGESAAHVDAEAGFAQTVAWVDHEVASRAVAGWSGRGYLVVVVDRFHVEGGRGVSWQAERLATAPVHAFLLAGADPLCAPGDRILGPW
jgi:hypothetical protein